MNKVIIVNNPTIKPHEELEGLFVIEYLIKDSEKASTIIKIINKIALIT